MFKPCSTHLNPPFFGHGMPRLASADCCSLSLEQLLSILQSDADAVPPVPSAPIAEDTMLCYVYTGDGHVKKLVGRPGVFAKS